MTVIPRGHAGPPGSFRPAPPDRHLPCGRHTLALMLDYGIGLSVRGDCLEPLIALYPHHGRTCCRDHHRWLRGFRAWPRTTPHRVHSPRLSPTRLRPTASRARDLLPTFTPNCSVPASAITEMRLHLRRRRSRPSPSRFNRQPQHRPTDRVSAPPRLRRTDRFSPHLHRSPPRKSRNSRSPRHSRRLSLTRPRPTASQATGQPPICSPSCSDPGGAPASKRERAG